MLSESGGRPSMLKSMCQHVARLQFDRCAKKHSLCGTVMIHDGLKLTCLDQCHGVRLLKWMLIERWRMPSMLSSMCQHVKGLTLICGYMRWFDTVTTCHIQAFSTWHWNRMSCMEALLIEPGFSLPYAFRSKKPGFLHRTPPPRRMSRTTFYVRWHRILKSVMLMGGFPALQRKTAFVEQSWWPEFDMFGSMPWCSFPRQKLIPKLAQKNCHTAVWI